MKKFNLAIFIICSITKLTLAQCISITATSGEPACAGSTGVMSLAVTGGATPYSYAWQGGETTANISGLIAGCYRVTVTENGGCSVDSVLCLQNSTGPTVIYMNSTDASCFGSTDGIINSNVVGGTTPYSSIIWYNDAYSIFFKHENFSPK